MVSNCMQGTRVTVALADGALVAQVSGKAGSRIPQEIRVFGEAKLEGAREVQAGALAGLRGAAREAEGTSVCRTLSRACRLTPRAQAGGKMRLP